MNAKYAISLAGTALFASVSLFADWSHNANDPQTNVHAGNYVVPSDNFVIDTTYGSLSVVKSGDQPGTFSNGKKGLVIKGANTASSKTPYVFEVKDTWMQNRGTMTLENVNLSQGWIYNEWKDSVLRVEGNVDGKGKNINTKDDAILQINKGAYLEIHTLVLESGGVLKIENGAPVSFKNNWEFITNPGTTISISLSNESLAATTDHRAVMHPRFTKSLKGKLELDLTNFVIDENFVAGTQYTFVLVHSWSDQNANGQFDDTWKVDASNVKDGPNAKFVKSEKDGSMLKVTIEAVSAQPES